MKTKRTKFQIEIERDAKRLNEIYDKLISDAKGVENE